MEYHVRNLGEQSGNGRECRIERVSREIDSALDEHGLANSGLGLFNQTRIQVQTCLEIGSAHVDDDIVHPGNFLVNNFRK
jgi:hypothetical protein